MLLGRSGKIDDSTESTVPEARGNLRSATSSRLELVYILYSGPSQAFKTTDAIRCPQIVRFLSYSRHPVFD